MVLCGGARHLRSRRARPGAAVSNRSTPEEGVHGRMQAVGGTYAAQAVCAGAGGRRQAVGGKCRQLAADGGRKR